ncbi:hypothetical protein [Bradyrhizobium sp. 150]|uniref:hypothetical protein n=1 Tax=Bradyrhizobium sp. 150 TaxID=2782625 RepID=UPI001FF8EA47|nr:hypothetical protein [Bradyrhizobium sp. 150]MCK1671071.1 hypothetical protein [Bradyrhizobium sp. 150]
MIGGLHLSNPNSFKGPKGYGMPRVLIGMEFSGAIRREMRARGVDCWSVCDMPSTDNSPFHIIGDVFDHLDDEWDGAIFHPTCTYNTIAAEWAYNDPDYVRYPGIGYHQNVKPSTLTGFARRGAREASITSVKRLLDCNIPRVTIENPRGILSTRIRKPDQTIQPWQFGDDASKATCLWVRGWPLLVADPAKRCHGRKVEWPRGSGKIVERWANQTDSNQNRESPSDDRWAKRSITYPGIAAAFAEQYAAVLFGEARMAAE